MNRAKYILVSLRLANSLLSAQIRSTTRPTRSQVTRSIKPYFSPFNAQQRLFFSSSPNSVVELVVANDWSSELENELGFSNFGWTHERVIYILKKLDKYPQKAFDFFRWVCERDEFSQSSLTYCSLLRVLLLEDMKKFWVTLARMKEEGFYLDEETYLTMLSELKKEKMAREVSALSHFYKTMLEENETNGVVSAIVNIVSKVVWSDEVEEQLEWLIDVDNLSDDLVIRVLRELRTSPSQALCFFDWVIQSLGYTQNSVTYNALARVLSLGNSMRDFWDVIERMKAQGFGLDIDSYVKISRHLQKKKMMEEAVKLYEFMMDGPYKPSIQDCSMLLRRLSATDNPDLSLVFRVAKKYESTGRTLSKAAYDGIHRCLTVAGRFDEAEKVIDIMKNAGDEPDNVTYSQLVFGLCKAKRLKEACDILEEMEANGCVPDIKTWTILIQGHCDACEVNKALICFTKMLEKNCDVDADLLEVLVKGFLSKQKVLGAYNLLVEMVDAAHLKPWQATYKNLIEKLLEVMKLEEAMNLLRLMKKQNYPPYPDPFVPYISKFGTVQDASDFLKALSVKEYPSVTAYLHVFKSFFKEGRHLEAKDLLFKCPHHVRKHRDICKLFGSADSKNNSAS